MAELSAEVGPFAQVPWAFLRAQPSGANEAPEALLLDAGSCLRHKSSAPAPKSLLATVFQRLLVELQPIHVIKHGVHIGVCKCDS
jgi:hypothetical protein